MYGWRILSVTKHENYTIIFSKYVLHLLKKILEWLIVSDILFIVENDNSLYWELWLLVKTMLYSDSYDFFFLMNMKIVKNWLKKYKNYFDKSTRIEATLQTNLKKWEWCFVLVSSLLNVNVIIVDFSYYLAIKWRLYLDLCIPIENIQLVNTREAFKTFNIRDKYF